MKNFLDGLAGMLMVSADRARNRRTLRRIQEANEQNQGIVRYAPARSRPSWTTPPPWVIS